jgi:hypothetical protein
MMTLTDHQVAELLAVAAGSVSYQSMYSRTTATIDGGRWTRKQYARDYLDDLIAAERKAAYVAPVIPTVSGKRAQSYAGPFPRGKHSHKCAGCEQFGQYHAVACYKSGCARPQLTATCSYCAHKFGGGR